MLYNFGILEKQLCNLHCSVLVQYILYIQPRYILVYTAIVPLSTLYCKVYTSFEVQRLCKVIYSVLYAHQIILKLRVHLSRMY